MLLTLLSANGHRGTILRLTVALDACKAADKVKDVGCNGKELIVRHPCQREGGRFVARVCRAIQIFECLFHIEYVRFKEIDLSQSVVGIHISTSRRNLQMLNGFCDILLHVLAIHIIFAERIGGKLATVTLGFEQMIEPLVAKLSEQIALHIELAKESVGVFVAVAHRPRQPLLRFILVLAVDDPVLSDGNYYLNIPYFTETQFAKFASLFDMNDEKVNDLLAEWIKSVRKNFENFVPKHLHDQINQWVNCYLYQIVGYVTDELIRRGILDKPDFERPLTNGVFCVEGKSINP